jgi:hypothetical protein
MNVLRILLHFCCCVTLTRYVALHIAESTLIKGLRCVFSMIVLAWNSEILLRELAWGRNWILLLQLVDHHHVSNLFLWTLQEAVDLTLPLMLDRIIPTLNTGWVHRQLSSRSLALFFVWTGNHDSRLWARWAWTRSPDFSMMAFLRLFEISTFYLLILILFFITPRVLGLFLVLERI